MYLYAKFCCSNSFGLGSIHRQIKKHTEILCIIAKIWTCTEFGVNWKCPYFLCLNSTGTTAWELHCVSPACYCSSVHYLGKHVMDVVSFSGYPESFQYNVWT